MIALPIFLQIKLEYNAMQTGLSLAPLSLTMFAMAILAGKRAGHRRSASIIRIGFALSTLGMALLIPIVPRASSGWYLRHPPDDRRSGARPARLPAQDDTLAPIDEQRVSEAAGVNSAAGSFGLSFGLAIAGGILLATLSLAFTNMVNDSTVIPSSQKQQISKSLENNAEVMSNTQLTKLFAGEPPAVQDEILKINNDSTNLALQVALRRSRSWPEGLGCCNSFRMMRLRVAARCRSRGARLGVERGISSLPTPRRKAV